MAFDSYSNLKAAVGSWLARSNLSVFVEDFITLAEERLSRELRIRGMETALSVTISSGVAAVPSDFRELKHARIDGTPTYPLEQKETPWIFDKYPTRSSTSRPEFIGVDGANFEFGPYPDAAYTVKGMYFAKPAVLSDSNTTNVWTTYAQDALFYAALCESAPFLGQDNRLALWESRYQAIKQGYNTEDRWKTHRGSRIATG